MAFSAATGLFYFAAKTDAMTLYAPAAKWQYDSHRDNVGGDDSYDGPLLAKFGTASAPYGELVAWNPVTERAAWRLRYPVVEGGGVLATAGKLVFQGRADGILAAYGAIDGRELWRYDRRHGIMAAPVSWSLDGVQYITLMAGWGGPSGLFHGPLAGAVRPGFGRILTFKLGGTGKLNATPYGHSNAPRDPGIPVDESPATLREGNRLYHGWCARCHGWNAIAGPEVDLRYASRETLIWLEDIVLRGTRASSGMPQFRQLDARGVRAIQAFLVTRARESAKAVR